MKFLLFFAALIALSYLLRSKSSGARRSSHDGFGGRTITVDPIYDDDVGGGDDGGGE